MIMSERAQFELARRLRSEGATIAEVFTFLSGLYFRGKIAYANAFARASRGICGALVITPTRGLIDAQTRITLDDLREFAEVDIHENDPRYREPLERDARKAREKTFARRFRCFARQYCHRKIRRRVARKFSGTFALSFRLCRTGRHEPRRTVVALRGGQNGIGIHFRRWRDRERQTTTETGAASLSNGNSVRVAKNDARIRHPYRDACSFSACHPERSEGPRIN